MPTVDSEPAPAPPSHREHRTVGAPVLLLTVGLVASGLFLASQARRLWFFGDDWQFLLHRSVTWSDLMVPHNEHWSALPVLAFRLMFHLFGIDHYLAYGLMPILLHLLCAALLYAVLRRNEVPAWPAVLTVIPFAFLVGDIAENPLWDFQIGFLGSAALGLIALLVADGDSWWRLVPTWVAGVLSLTCSGMALPMVGWIAVHVLLNRGLRRALASVVPIGGVYLIWYVAYGRDAGSPAPRPTAGEFARFAIAGLAHLWDETFRAPELVGVLVLLALVVFAARVPLSARQRALALSGLVALCALYLLLGWSRAGLGVEAARTSRYAYFAALFGFPVLALALDRLGGSLRRRPGVRGVLAAAVAALLVANGVTQTLGEADHRSSETAGLRGRLLGVQQLLAEGARTLTPFVSPALNPDITVSDLQRPSIEAALPGGHASRTDVLDGSSAVQVTGSVEELGLPDAQGIRLHGVTGKVRPGHCANLRSGRSGWVEVPPVPGGAQLQLTSRRGTYVTELRSGRLTSLPTPVVVPHRTPVHIGSVSTLGALWIGLPPGRVQLCLTPTS